MNTKNKQRARLALAELQKEMEILTKEEANACKGGSSTGIYNPSECDCFFQCLDYASNKYGYDHPSGYYASQYYSSSESSCGINAGDADGFASQYFSRSYLNENVSGVLENFVKNQNNTLIASYNTYVEGSTGMQIQHAVIVQYIDPNTGGMVCYDPQQNRTVIIDRNQVQSFMGITGGCN